jgi:drug/metabolite transporter (DMT)-like permease
VIILSIFLLKEPFSINKLIGCLTIITGILIYNI